MLCACRRAELRAELRGELRAELVGELRAELRALGVEQATARQASQGEAQQQALQVCDAASASPAAGHSAAVDAAAPSCTSRR